MSHCAVTSIPQLSYAITAWTSRGYPRRSIKGLCDFRDFCRDSPFTKCFLLLIAVIPMPRTTSQSSRGPSRVRSITCQLQSTISGSTLTSAPMSPLKGKGKRKRKFIPTSIDGNPAATLPSSTMGIPDILVLPQDPVMSSSSPNTSSTTTGSLLYSPSVSMAVGPPMMMMVHPLYMIPIGGGNFPPPPTTSSLDAPTVGTMSGSDPFSSRHPVQGMDAIGCGTQRQMPVPNVDVLPVGPGHRNVYNWVSVS